MESYTDRSRSRGAVGTCDWNHSIWGFVRSLHLRHVSPSFTFERLPQAYGCVQPVQSPTDTVTMQMWARLTHRQMEAQVEGSR